MSIESAKAFMDRMKTDEEFAKKVTACKDSDAVVALVQAAGFEFNEDEIREIAGELSDTELERVAGGYTGCPAPAVFGLFW